MQGNTHISATSYRIDLGKEQKLKIQEQKQAQLPNIQSTEELPGFRNNDLCLSDAELLNNIQVVQKRQGLTISDKLISNKACPFNLDVEMETGTGQNYCYIKSMFELNKQYGWTKFIIVVPSIAIREGVKKSFEITAEHFNQHYSKKARFFIYNSKQLHNLEGFSADAGISVMIINMQAFNATGKDNRRIYEELDDFQSRKPIDVISANRPILILDEPQKMEGAKTLESLEKFKPLFVLRYSATHKTPHNKIHRLDALDAYNQKLVKKIAVRGISVKGLQGSSAYLYLESIEISKKAPVARLELEVRLKSGIIKRQTMHLEKGKNLFDLSNQLEQYRGFIISQIDYTGNTIEFTNGLVLQLGEASGDVTELAKRHIQIRETIKAHLEKEAQLFGQGVKVLSLFFIDSVKKYRDYEQENHKGEYAQIFEEEYSLAVANFIHDNALINVNYCKYLSSIQPEQTHNGYFAIDKKSKHFVDPEKIDKKTQESSDSDAYDLILKDKERLLSFAEPVRFIFSHSALREGWDNPNVFCMCMLKNSDNTTTRRQEVGRGLRIAINQHGERMDNPETVHDINVLCVVTSESYTDFVNELQKEILGSLSERPQKANATYFVNKVICLESGDLTINESMARALDRYLVQNQYTDSDDNITPAYHKARAAETLAPLPAELVPYAEYIFQLVDSVFDKSVFDNMFGDDRKAKINPLNNNFNKKEFQALWKRINHKAIYQVDFDSDELIDKCIKCLNAELRVSPLQYNIQIGIQNKNLTDTDLKAGTGFTVKNSSTENHTGSVYSTVKYDLLGSITETTGLTRKTIATILGKINAGVFSQFTQNPEQFVVESARLINEQKGCAVVEYLSYNVLASHYDINIFTANQSKYNINSKDEPLKKHIYDYVVTDSKVESDFASALDTSSEVVVYAKLPKGFAIPTPIGAYNPDWAIAFKEGDVKHVYFVAETKGAMSSMSLRSTEKSKIDCAEKFFETINKKYASEQVKYKVVASFDKLMEIIR